MRPARAARKGTSRVDRADKAPDGQRISAPRWWRSEPRILLSAFSTAIARRRARSGGSAGRARGSPDPRRSAARDRCRRGGAPRAAGRRSSAPRGAPRRPASTRPPRRRGRGRPAAPPGWRSPGDPSGTSASSRWTSSSASTGRPASPHASTTRGWISPSEPYGRPARRTRGPCGPGAGAGAALGRLGPVGRAVGRPGRRGGHP